MADVAVQCLLKLCYRVVDSILRQFVRARRSRVFSECVCVFNREVVCVR